MSFVARLYCLSLLLLLGACATPARHPGPQHGSRPPLLLISIDGYRADYIRRGRSPILQSMADDGVRARAMQPAFPTLTFPNHYTLVTGLYPDHHGIVDNTMDDPTLGAFSLADRAAVADGRWWSGGTPIWVSADRAGLITATMFWPGSGTRIDGLRPDHWLPFDGTVTPDERVDQVLAWLDLPPSRRPDFLTLYFDRVDDAGHDHGPDSPQLDDALGTIDAALKRLVEGLRARGLYRRMNIIVVSDHGMAATPEGQWILADRLVDTRHVHIVTLGAMAGFEPHPGFAAELRAQLLRPHPHMTCWDRAHIPARMHYGANPRVPPLVCLAHVGWQFTTTSAVAARATSPMMLGDHGFDNADPRMRALFVAHGPAFRRGVVVPEFPNVDVYGLMTHLLGIRPQPNDGDFQAVRGMLEPTP